MDLMWAIICSTSPVEFFAVTNWLVHQFSSWARWFVLAFLLLSICSSGKLYVHMPKPHTQYQFFIDPSKHCFHIYLLLNRLSKCILIFECRNIAHIAKVKVMKRHGHWQDLPIPSRYILFYTHIWSFLLSYGGISCCVTSVGEKLLDFRITKDPKTHLTMLDSYPIVLLCKPCLFMFLRSSLLLSLSIFIIWWLLGDLSSMDILGLNVHLIHFHFIHLLFFLFQFTSGIKICFINILSILYTASGPLYASTCLAFLVDWIHGVHRTSTRGVM